MTIPDPEPSSPPRWTLEGFRVGALAVLPILPGVAAYAVAFGIVAARKEFTLLETLLMTGVVYAGMAQMIVLENWPAQMTGSAIIAVLALTAIVNARLFLISATFRPFFGGSSGAKVYPSLFLIGEPIWLLAMRYRKGGGRDPAFLVGSGIVIWVVWVAATVPGFMLGAAAGDPRRFGLDLIMPAFFMAMLVPLWRGPRRATGWIVAAVTAVAAQYVLGGFWYLIIGTLAGAVAGAVADD